MARNGISYNRFISKLELVWELFGNCLELSKTDNQSVKGKNGNKCGTCLGSV